MNIGGFEITGKMIACVAAVAGVVGIGSLVGKMNQQKEIERQRESLAALEASREAAQNVVNETMSYHDKEQAKLREKYNIVPPEGFELDYDGSLVAIGNDEDTAEDIVFKYLRALSMLDFSTAESASSNSSVIEDYRDYYDQATSGYNNYYDDFLRKQFKTSIESIEIVEVGDVAVFADGTEHVTVVVETLNLENKDFWQSDRTALFEELEVYDETEDDDAKLRNRVYDYLIDAYESGLVGKREHTVELVVDKLNSGGWLVSNDRELDAILKYEEGVDVAKYILNEYQEWEIEQRDLRIKNR